MRAASSRRSTSCAPSARAGATTRSAPRWGTSGDDVRRVRYAKGIRPSYRRVDSCAGEVEAGSNYYYSTWGEEDEALPPATKPRVVIIGSGPNRIGQGIEFDYCCVHAVQTFRALGYEAVMINCNPETVSTDYDTSDRLYFEPLSPEEVLAVLDREQPEGVVTQFGGQTPLRLARAHRGRGVRDHGHAARGDRPRRGPRAVRRPGRRARHPLPALGDGRGRRPGARGRGGDRLSRCSSGPRTCSAAGRCASATTTTQLRQAMDAVSGSVLVDRFVENAVEIDVDALCDGEDVFIAAVMQHVEEAGVHSGDSSCVLPGAVAHARERARGRAHRQAARAGARRRRAAQHPARDRRLDRLRARGEPAGLAHGAVRLEGDRDQPRRGGLQARRGQKLRDLDLPTPRPQQVSVKAAVLPFARFPGADPVLGPEMRSTGEVMASASDLPTAFAKAERAAGRPLPSSGTAFISVNDTDKPSVVPIAAALAGLGFELVATDGTARTLRAAGLEVGEIAKVADADDRRADRRRPRPRGPLRPDRQHAAGLRAPAPTATASARPRSARACRASRRSPGAAAAVHAIANARAETALSLQERIETGA